MARRDGGGRGGRVLPGLHEALLAAARRFDESWHIDHDCGCCERVAALEAGQARVYRGHDLWHALFERRYPDRNPDLLHDQTLYVVTGDRLTPVDD